MHTVKTTAGAVQIYRSGADVTRTGRTELVKGVNELEIAGLSNNAVIDTVKLFFPAGIQLADIRFRHGADEEDDDRESVRIRERIADLQKKTEVLELQAELWKENGSFSGTAKPDLAEVEHYIEKLPERLNGLYEEINSLKKEIKLQQRALKEADRLENLPMITAVLDAPESGTYDFEVQYHEQAASWEPVYEVHTDAEGPLTLKVRARLFQHTGEDWEAVKTSLLTSTPSGGSLPVLDPVYLNFRTAVQSSGSVRRSSAKMMRNMVYEEDAMAMEDAAPMMMGAMAGTAQLERLETYGAETESSDTLTEYTLPGTKTITAGTKGTMADLLEYQLPAEYAVSAVPKMDVRAYLAAKVKTQDLPEDIHGTAGIYLNGVYAGETDITADLTKETLDIPLGKEEGIQVSRTEKKRKTSEAMLKNQRTTEYAYELKITNGKDKETEITVTDQIPVSQDKTIVVEAVDKDGAEFKEETGILTWKLKLEPKETKTLNLAYKVSWPKDKTLEETHNIPFCRVCGARTYGQRYCPECGAKIY